MTSEILAEALIEQFSKEITELSSSGRLTGYPEVILRRCACKVLGLLSRCT
jgi:hypothetical protein